MSARSAVDAVNEHLFVITLQAGEERRSAVPAQKLQRSRTIFSAVDVVSERNDLMVMAPSMPSDGSQGPSQQVVAPVKVADDVGKMNHAAPFSPLGAVETPWPRRSESFTYSLIAAEPTGLKAGRPALVTPRPRRS